MLWGAESYQGRYVVTPQFGAENDDQIRFGPECVAQLGERFGCNSRDGLRGGIISGKVLGELTFASRRKLREAGRLSAELDGLRVDDVQLGAMQPYVVADLPRQQRMLIRRIVADQQDRWRLEDLAHARRFRVIPGEGLGERRIIRRAVMVDIIGSQHQTRELLKQIILFVRGAVGTDNADCIRAVASDDLAKVAGNGIDCFRPGDGNKPAIAAHHWLLDALGMVGEIEGVASLDAEKIAVDAALVAIVSAHDLNAAVAAAAAQRREATIAAVGADGADVVHLPRTRLVSVSSRGKCADRTDVDAHAAFLALEVIAIVRSDNRTLAAVLDAQRPHVHALAADADAAIAQNAARAVKEDDRGPLLLVAVALDVDKLRLRRSILERHVLQLALASGVADRTIQRMIGKQQLEHALARLHNLFGLGVHDHALANLRGAGGLKLRQLFDFHQAHAAGALQRKPGVIAERRHFDACILAGIDQQRAGGNR